MKLLDGAELLGVHSNRQEVLRAVFEMASFTQLNKQTNETNKPNRSIRISGGIFVKNGE